MKTIEDKIKSRQYATVGIASAVVKRADISAQQRNKLLELVKRTYEADEQPDSVPGVIVKLPSARTQFGKLPTLDQHLLQISVKLLGLAIVHKMSREQIFAKLKAQLMAGVG